MFFLCYRKMEAALFLAGPRPAIQVTESQEVEEGGEGADLCRVISGT